MGWGAAGGIGGGGRGRLYTYRHIVTTGMTPAIKMGSDENHFNVLLIVRDKVTIRQCPRTTTFLNEEKGEPKRKRVEVLLLTSPETLHYNAVVSLASLKPFINWANVCSRT